MRRLLTYAAILFFGIVPGVLAFLIQAFFLLVLCLATYTTGDGEFRFYDQMRHGVWGISAIAVIASGLHIYQMFREKNK